MSKKNRIRIRLFVLLLFIVPMGFMTKFYYGPWYFFISNQLGGLLYVVFWCLLFYILFSVKKPLKLCLIVLLVTIGLEFLQLWNPAFLEGIRKSFLGQALIGNQFNGMDILFYFLGSAVAYIIIVLFRK
jgi:hypothetical protein